MSDDLVQRAKDLAHRAHAGQVDKAGKPYIEHVARVAGAVSDDPFAEAVAWLHDVIEDTAGDEQNRIGHHIEDSFPAAVVNAVLALTRFEGYPEGNYYADIREDEIALRVKLADIADNSDELRLTLLGEETAERLRRKYARAIQALKGADGER